jgi:hypothetical protein
VNRETQFLKDVGNALLKNDFMTDWMTAGEVKNAAKRAHVHYAGGLLTAKDIEYVIRGIVHEGGTLRIHDIEVEMTIERRRARTLVIRFRRPEPEFIDAPIMVPSRSDARAMAGNHP